MTPYQPSPELRRLIDQLLDDGTLGRAELARLEELLEDDDALDYYIEVTQQDVALRSLSGELKLDAEPVAVSRIPRFLWQAAAAVGLFAAGFLVSPSHRGDKQVVTLSNPENVVRESPSPARITGMVGVRWTDGAPPDLIRTAGGAGGLSIESGLLEVTYASGVRVTIEGPARFGVTGPASGTLEGGKLVTAVPKGAEGFRIDYPDGTVVDLGTEFAMEVKAGAHSEVGVFDGEIELHRTGQKTVALYENHAVRHIAGQDGTALQAVPLDRSKYVRQIPSREFAWEISSPSPMDLEFDVSHLLWKPAAYRAVFKWISGVDGIAVSDVELRLDGKTLARDEHQGTTGYVPDVVSDNIYKLDVPVKSFRPGKWTLHVRVKPLTREGSGIRQGTPFDSLGILQFEEGLVTTATPSDFVGRWSYRYLGKHFVREFHSDGTATLYIDGKAEPGCFAGCHWSVNDGILSLTMPHTKACEDHILRDHGTLVFMNRNYENACRLATDSQPQSQ